MSYVDLKFFNLVVFTLLGLLVVGRSLRGRAVWLTAMSLFFLISWSWASALAVSVLGAFNYWLGGRLVLSKSHRNAWFYGGVFFQVVVLLLFRDFKPLENTTYNFRFESGLLLVGLSYVVFQNITYLSDLKHGREPGTFLGYMHFVTYFPKVLMGPLADDRDFEPKPFASLRSVLSDKVERGKRIAVWIDSLALIGLGLFKTLVLSQAIFKFNSMALEAYNLNVDSSPPIPIASFWVASVMSWFMVYCDFSGCIDVVRGTSRLLGISLPENFNRPYLATNPVDYWQRWNITLVDWFRRHIYFPILLRTKNIYVATALAMVAIGLWHGVMKHLLLWTLAWIILQWAYLIFRSSVGFKMMTSSALRRRLGSALGGVFIFHFSAVLGLLTIMPIFYSSDISMYRPDFGRFLDSQVFQLIAKYPESFFLIPFVPLGDKICRLKHGEDIGAATLWSNRAAKTLLAVFFVFLVWRLSSGTSYLFYYLRL